MTKRNALFGALLGIALLAGPTVGGEGAAEAKKTDIVRTAIEAGSFKTLAAALDAAGLVEALQAKGPFTVFAPTDAAFAKLPEGTVESLLQPKNRERLAAVLTYHVVPGRLGAADVARVSGVTTLQGQRLELRSDAKGVRVDGASVVKADIACSNGVIHVIDTVVLPEERDCVAVAAGAKSFGTLVAAVKAAGLEDTLRGKGPFTIFAPTDEAFARLPAGTLESLLKPENRAKLVRILTFHVVPGRIYSEDAVKAGKATTLAKLDLDIRVADEGAYVGKARLVSTDIDGSNGVIHVIDTVLVPESSS